MPERKASKRRSKLPRITPNLIKALKKRKLDSRISPIRLSFKDRFKMDEKKEKLLRRTNSSFSKETTKMVKNKAMEF
jgi:hypothetical protein